MPILFLLFIWTPISTIIRGATIVTFWSWFVSGPNSPFFPHVPDVAFIQALGLSIIVTLFVFQFTGGGEDENAATLAVKTVSKTIIFYGLMWAMALIVHGLA